MNNLLLDVDGYKTSHYKLYPDNVANLQAYLVARGGSYSSVVNFGLQGFINRHLSKVPTMADVDEAAAICSFFRIPFNALDWEQLTDIGYWPLLIKARREGVEVPIGSPILTVEATDPRFKWLVTWLETKLIRMWYPITVATLSRHIKDIIYDGLMKSADDPDGEIDFKLCDFGARGVSSQESAAIGGAAHLLNFRCSDNLPAVEYLVNNYGLEFADFNRCVGFSIPATEHSNIISWGRVFEDKAYANFVKKYALFGNTIACVIDSYDALKAVDMICKNHAEDINALNTTFFIRPDSGDPVSSVLAVLRRMEGHLGTTINNKGFRVLPVNWKVLQGDGINDASIKSIIDAVIIAGYSLSNVSFGMGGALLQQVNRDTCKFAYKVNAVFTDGEWVGVCKNPVDDVSKRSHSGYIDSSELSAVYFNGHHVTCNFSDLK